MVNGDSDLDSYYF